MGRGLKKMQKKLEKAKKKESIEEKNYREIMSQMDLIKKQYRLVIGMMIFGPFCSLFFLVGFALSMIFLSGLWLFMSIAALALVELFTKRYMVSHSEDIIKICKGLMK